MVSGGIGAYTLWGAGCAAGVARLLLPLLVAALLAPPPLGCLDANSAARVEGTLHEWSRIGSPPPHVLILLSLLCVLSIAPCSPPSVRQPPKVQKSKAAKLLAAQSSSKSKGKKKVSSNRNDDNEGGSNGREELDWIMVEVEQQRREIRDSRLDAALLFFSSSPPFSAMRKPPPSSIQRQLQLGREQEGVQWIM